MKPDTSGETENQEMIVRSDRSSIGKLSATLDTNNDYIAF